MRVYIWMAAAVVLVGCAKPVAEAPAKPSQVMTETFHACTWEQVTGKTLSIWSYACGEGMGSVKLVADDPVGGFALQSTAPDSPGARVVIRSFAKDKAAPVSAILPAVLGATGTHGASCQLVEHKGYGDWGDVWLLEPTGAEKVAYDKASEAEPQDNPCGELGIGPAGDRFFRLLPADPSRVIYADMGSEIQIFDLSTLKAK